MKAMVKIPKPHTHETEVLTENLPHMQSRKAENSRSPEAEQIFIISENVN